VLEGVTLARDLVNAPHHVLTPAQFAAEVASKKSRASWFCTLEAGCGAKARHLLVDSLTFNGWMPGTEKLKVAAARAMSSLRNYSLSRAAIALPEGSAAAVAADILEGAWLGDYRDQRFKSAPPDRPAIALRFAAPKAEAAAVRAALAGRAAVLEGVTLARDLVNAPHHVLTPAQFAAEARKVARRHRMTCEVLDEKQLRRQGYELIWNVGRGSEYPPRLIVLKYAPRRRSLKTHVALVGKGMTFDTGGLCIKGRTMHEMNCDMGGGAAVLGVMDAIGRLKLPVRVTAVIAAAHNAVDGAAYTPGCIIKSKSGKTVYVENTDAEGRLVLADAFVRAGMERPDVMIDYATLTGAAGRALGPALAALFTDDEDLAARLAAAGDRTGDNLWRLPLWREYDSYIEHHLADVQNVSRVPDGGAIHAANFLKAFIPEGVRWAHLDIAARAMGGKQRYFGADATGYGVRLTAGLLLQAIEDKAL